MAGGRLKLSIPLIVLGAWALLSAPLEGQSQAKAKRQVQIPPVSQPAPAAAPLPPEQMPAQPPQVAFNGGQLTITASNSTLGDILRAVRRQTGASVDVPANATERVVGKFGPGPARDVLASLLNGSHFNYFLLGSATNPNALDRVMLTSKAATASNPPATSANASGPTQPPAGGAFPGDSMEVSSEDSGMEAQQELTDTLTDDQANQQVDEQQQQQQQQVNPFGQPGGVRTPEQLLQELQQRQQQLQQQQQQGGPPTPFPVPQNPPRQP